MSRVWIEKRPRLETLERRYANKEFDKLSGRDWAKLVFNHPEYADDCAWEKFTGDVWRDLLSLEPMYSTKCDWQKLSGADWIELVGRPGDLQSNVSELPNAKVVELLKECPNFVGLCGLKRLTREDWDALYEVRERLLNVRTAK